MLWASGYLYSRGLSTKYYNASQMILKQRITCCARAFGGGIRALSSHSLMMERDGVLDNRARGMSKQARARPANTVSSVSVCAARTLNAAGHSVRRALVTPGSRYGCHI